MEKYKKEEKLGNGTYGNVFNATDLQTGEKVIMKRIRFDQEENGIDSLSCREITMFKSMSHPCIVNVKDIVSDETCVMIIFEKMDCDLRKYINFSKSMPISLIQSYAYQILSGIVYLHSNGIIHRNISPANILINQNGSAKICDFESSRFYSVPILPMTPSVTSLWYRSPEMLMGTDLYTPSVDVWSCGCLIAEMVNRHPLFAGDSDIDQLMKIFDILGSPTLETWPDFQKMPRYHHKLPERKGKPFASCLQTDNSQLIDLLQKMLTLDPSKRINAIECLKHPFFSSISHAIIDLCNPIL